MLKQYKHCHSSEIDKSKADGCNPSGGTFVNPCNSGSGPASDEFPLRNHFERCAGAPNTPLEFVLIDVSGHVGW
ncbi:hypothetical protein EVAR_37630_1 [Eumeta japonica]|uniref:Uncharacterized protein n=1 Tax=Eumeta variegata TaxID=151549 RepID=A0A4C1VPY1_EUMVA|nr:hypothetical protein EVAR_37630_1 [Eumeta japonica]